MGSVLFSIFIDDLERGRRDDIKFADDTELGREVNNPGRYRNPKELHTSEKLGGCEQDAIQKE